MSADAAGGIRRGGGWFIFDELEPIMKPFWRISLDVGEVFEGLEERVSWRDFFWHCSMRLFFFEKVE